jgi:hypothetical protein
MTGLAAEQRAIPAIFKSILLALSVGTGNIVGDILAVKYERHELGSFIPPTFWQTLTAEVVKDDNQVDTIVAKINSDDDSEHKLSLYSSMLLMLIFGAGQTILIKSQDDVFVSKT